MSNLYDDVAATYRHLTRRPLPWLPELGYRSLDDLVAVIRDDHPDSTRSDTTLRRLIELGRHHSDATTVALYALAPRLSARLGRAVTSEYRHDALTDLATVLLDSDHDGPRLAARLVNRAHNRTYKAARRVTQRGVRTVITTFPLDPDRLTALARPEDDIATAVTRHVDLVRFSRAVHAAIDAGTLTEAAWSAYRDHRLRGALRPDDRVATSHERTTASRTAHKLESLITTYLHAA